MVEAPERIWATFEPHESGKGHPHTYATAMPTNGHEYVRADLYEQVVRERNLADKLARIRSMDNEGLRERLRIAKRELEQVKRERDGFRDIAARKSDQVAALIKAEAAERLACTPVVTDEMVGAALKSLHSNPVSWEHPETIRGALTAALAEPAGWERVTEEDDAEYLNPPKGWLAKEVTEPAREAEPSKWSIPGSSYAGASTPPDASAIREALERLVKLRKDTVSDVATAHKLRGNGASDWMREDDRDFRRDLNSAFDAAEAALAGAKP